MKWTFVIRVIRCYGVSIFTVNSTLSFTSYKEYSNCQCYMYSLWNTHFDLQENVNFLETIFKRIAYLYAFIVACSNARIYRIYIELRANAFMKDGHILINSLLANCINRVIKDLMIHMYLLWQKKSYRLSSPCYDMKIITYIIYSRHVFWRYSITTTAERIFKLEIFENLSLSLDLFVRCQRLSDN